MEYHCNDLNNPLNRAFAKDYYNPKAFIPVQVNLAKVVKVKPVHLEAIDKAILEVPSTHVAGVDLEKRALKLIKNAVRNLPNVIFNEDEVKKHATHLDYFKFGFGVVYSRTHARFLDEHEKETFTVWYVFCTKRSGYVVNEKQLFNLPKMPGWRDLLIHIKQRITIGWKY